MLGLSLLALRRALPVWLLAGFVALLFLAARSSAGPPLLEGDERAQAGLRALARQNVWSILLALAPLFFLQAARLGTPAASAWLVPTGAPRLALALALASGCALACGAATALAAVVSEATLASAHPAWRRVSELPSPSGVLLDAAPSLRWSVPPAAAGQRLRLATTVAIGSGPAVSARFTARAGELATAVEARVAGRTALELEPPGPADGPLELELERVGPGALLVLPPHALELLAPVGSERLTALAVGLRVFLCLTTGCALAFGLASRMRASLAAALVLTLALSSWSGARAASLVPGADLPRAWRELGAGLVPAWAPLTSLAGALVLSALGLALWAHSSSGGETRA